MDEFRISTNTDEFDLAAIHHFLSKEAYWSKGIEFDTLRKSIDNSLCFAGFIGTQQIAFGRAVTDLTTFAFLRDIFVLPAFRGNGYGARLTDSILTRLRDEGVPSIMLGTEDAHGLYEKFGFARVGNSTRLMVWRQKSGNA
jgi:GNAT superfamily N-acetyltransferase